MSTTRLPQSINPARLAYQSVRLEGEIPLKLMRRIAATVGADEGVVQVGLQFDVDAEGYRTVTGKLEATLQLVCQRCLKPYEHSLEAQVSSAFLADERKVEELPGHLEPVILEEDWLDLATMVEDELILSIPIVPMHNESECSVQLGEMEQAEVLEEPEERDNPFAILAALKKKT